MHPAIIKRRDQLVAEGRDPGPFYGDDGDYAYMIGSHTIVAPTLFGKFEIDTKLYPAVDSAWFYADAIHARRFDAAVPPPGPAPATVLGVDVSNYQPRDLSALIQQYGFQHVVVRLWLPEEIPDAQYSLDQLHSAIDNGCTVGGYYWGYKNLEPERSAENALELWTRANVGNLPVLWPDIEVYANEGCPNQDWTLAACRHAVQMGQLGGVYSSDYMIDTYWGSYPQELQTYYYWCANYNGQPTLDVPSKYWSKVHGHQYWSKPVDFNVFATEVTVR